MAFAKLGSSGGRFPTPLKPLMALASLGDSRVARFYQSLGNNFGFSGYTHFTCANARAKHPFKVVYNGGNSGDQSDQMLARLPAAIASGAGTMWIQIGVNDVNNAGTGYTTVNTIGPNQGVAVTTANVALVCFQNMQYAAQQFLQAGGQCVIINLECGAEVFGTAQIAACINLNQRLREFAEVTQGVLIYDLWSQMHDPAASTTSTLRFKSGYAAEASGSGTHMSNKGAYVVGKDLAAFFASNFPTAIPYLPSDVNEVTGITTNNLLLNPMFMTTSGGTGSGSNGITGTIPGSWTVDRTGGGGTQTAVISTGTPGDGSPGTECIMACTFAAAGDIIRIRQDAVIANISIGDILEGVGVVVVDAGGVLAGVQMDLQYSDGSATWNLTDLKPLDNNPIPTDGVTYYMKTPPYPVTVKSGSPFMSMRLYAIGSGSGTATVRWRSLQARKRFAL